MNYYIADLHLFHNNVTQSGSDFDHRPYKDLDEMHRDFKTRWNAKVADRDWVHIIGDISFKGKPDDVIPYLKKLKGHKVLVKGNHDRFTNTQFSEAIEEVYDYRRIRDILDGTAVKVVLSHYPMMMWDGQHHGSILLYGHVHNSPEETFYQDSLRSLNESLLKESPARAYNVGCMMPYMDYTPRSLDEIVHGKEAYDASQ